MARGFNKVILVGNLARDPQIRYTASQQAVANFSIAVNRSWKGRNGEIQESVDFIPIVVWGPGAETCERYLRKGSALLVEGRISTRSYEAKTGEKRYVTEVVAEHFQFLGGRRDDGDGYSAHSGSSRQGGQEGGRGSSEPRSFRDEIPPFGGAGNDFGDGFPIDISKLGDSADGEADIPF